jgi:predicted dehydrogenase
MKTVKVAVVGLGKMGFLHASILNFMPNVELVALCDKSTIISRLAKKLFKKCLIVKDVEKLADLNLDSVYVTTPIPAHFPVIRTLYSKEVARNIFVEKTLASNWDEANRLCELAKSSDGSNMVGYMERYAVTFRYARDLLNQGILGPLASFEAHAYSSDFAGMNSGSKMPNSRGGALSDLGSHVIDLALWFFGNLEVESAVLELAAEGGSEDSASFKVDRGDLRGEFRISWCKEGYRMPYFGLEIRGNKGVMKVSNDDLELTVKGRGLTNWYRQDLDDHVDFLLGEAEYYREDEHFIKSVLTSIKADPDFATASKVDYIIDQVKKKDEENE